MFSRRWCLLWVMLWVFMVNGLPLLAAPKDMLDSLGCFEAGEGPVSHADLPPGWVVISGPSPKQRLSDGEGHASARSLKFTKTGTEYGLCHRIALPLRNTTIPRGALVTLSFDYYCAEGHNSIHAGLGVGLSVDGGNPSSYDGTNNYIEGLHQILTEDCIETSKWTTVIKRVRIDEPLRNPFVMIYENYWDKEPYEISIDNVKLLVDGDIDMRSAKDEILALSDSTRFASSGWQRGEDHGSRQDMQIEPVGSSGFSVRYTKEIGGGYCTVFKRVDPPVDLLDYTSVVLNADFSGNVQEQRRSINNEGHSGIALWLQDSEGRKAYYDVYSVVPLGDGAYRYYYLLDYPLGPFNGHPDRRVIAAYGLQVSKVERGGSGGFAVNSVNVLLSPDLGDAEIGRLYREGIATLAASRKPDVKGYYVIAGTANAKYRPNYVPSEEALLAEPVLAVASARQGTAHTQIVFVPTPEAKGRKVVLKLGPLVGEEHSVSLAEDCIRVFAVGDVPLKPNEIVTRYAGWHPDILFERNDLDLVGSKTQAAWLQIDVPAGIPADVYKGTVEIAGTDGRTLAVIPLHLTVWDIDLPRENKIRTSFWAFRGMVAAFEGKESIAVEDMYPYYKLALEHRLSPVDQNDGTRALYAIYHEKDGSITLDTLEFEKVLTFCKEHSNGSFNAFHIAEHAWFGIMLKNGFSITDRESGEPWVYDNAPFSAENRRIFKTVIDTLCDVADRHGLLDYAYIQPFDEPSSGEPLFPQIIAAIKAMDLRVPIQVVFALNQSIDAYPEMVKDIDIWTPTLYTLRDSDVDFQHGRRKEIWSYVCMGGGMLVPNSPNHDRWFFLQNYRMGVTGFLNWGLNYWGSISKETWDEGTYDGYGRHDNSAAGQGDGVLMYPYGVPSIRLKGLMRGVEDYQYAWLLREAYAAKKDAPTGRSVAADVAALLAMDELMKQIEAGNEMCIDAWREDVARVLVELK